HLKLVLGRDRVGTVPVWLFHLLIVRHGYLQLRITRLGKKREEHAKILVSGNSLSEVGRAAFFIVGISNREFRFGQVFAVGIRVDQRLHTQTPDLLASVLNVFQRAVV